MQQRDVMPKPQLTTDDLLANLGCQAGTVLGL